MTEKEKLKGLAVEKKQAQKTIQLLDSIKARKKNVKPLKKKKKIIIPLEKKAKKTALEKLLKRKKISFQVVSALFEKQSPKVLSLKQALKGKLSQKEIDLAIGAYNVLGDIAVLEIPEKLKKKEKIIARALLETNPRLKTILKKSGVTKGKYRVHPVKFLAGEKKALAFYKESGCQFKIPLGKVFFSPRLQKERLRISKLIKKGEIIGALFAGVGPFPIVFAKNSPMKKALAVELNPLAFKQMKENITLNKAGDKIEPIQGDVKKIVAKKLKGKCDRVVMPLPKGGETFLREAIQCIKPEGGIIHFYQFTSTEKPFKKPLEFIKQACQQEKRKCRILRKAKVRTFSPKIIQVVIDFKVK